MIVSDLITVLKYLLLLLFLPLAFGTSKSRFRISGIDITLFGEDFQVEHHPDEAPHMADFLDF